MNVSTRNHAIGMLVLALVAGNNLAAENNGDANTQAQVVQPAGPMSGELKALEASATSDSARQELLYNLERGELLRLNRQYPESTQAFLLADKKVAEWEDTAKADPQRLFANLGAAIISERLKNYEGQDYEKVWLTTHLALNRVAVGDLETARVDIKRTHEREAVIAEFRAKETSAAEEEAKAKGATNTGKELNGYPVETLNDPEVLALKNGYQNALSHYLSGFLYEVMNEPGLAAPGYRKAIELVPDTAVLEEGLRGLDNRTSFTHKRRQNMTDVLFLVEAGDAPVRQPKTFTIPVPLGGGVGSASMSWVVIQPSKDPLLTKLSVGGNDLKLERVVDVNVMARRALKDEMPGLMFRSITRAIVKGAVQNQLQKNAGMFGAVLGMVASVATEQADDRMWHRLPGRAYLARAYLPEGEHKLSLEGREFTIKVGGQYALVPLRLASNNLIVGDVGSFGTLVAQPPAAMNEVKVEPKAEEAKPAAIKPKAKPVAKPTAPTNPAGTK